MSIQCVNGKRVLVKCYPYDLANINEILKQVDAIGYRAFDGTDLLTEINIPENVKEIGDRAFANCINLKKVTLPSTLSEIGMGAFSCCKNLEEINLDNVKEIHSGAFGYCKKLEHVTLAEDCSVAAEMFEGAGLKSITIPNCDLINAMAFLDCDDLEQVTIKLGKEISDNCFRRCGNLSKVSLPNTLESIGANAFYLCKNLTDIDIPENVNMIKKGAFANTGLTEVLLNPRTEVLDQVFDKEVRISYRKMSDLYLLNEINEIVKSNDKISNHFKEEVDRLIVHMIARAKEEENKSEAIEKNINSDNTTFTYIIIDRL